MEGRARLGGGEGKQVSEIELGGGFGAFGQRGRNDDRLAVIFKPRKEHGAFRAWEALLVDPVVPGGHFRIDEGAGGIEFGVGTGAQEELIHGALPLARGKANEQSQWLGTAKDFAGSPLREGGAVNLCA